MSSSVPEGIDDTKKVPGLYPPCSIRQWNAVVDVLAAEELVAEPNADALTVRDGLRRYLITCGYRKVTTA